MAADDDPLGVGGSISARAANGEGTEDDGGEPELFPMGSLEGDAKTLKSLIRSGQAVKSTVSMTGAEVPVRSGGLLDPEKEGMLLVTFEVAHYTPVPVREGDRETGKRLTEWKIRQTVRPIHIERVDGEDGIIEANFAMLAEANPTAAGALLDRMRARLTDALNGATPEAKARGAKATA